MRELLWIFLAALFWISFNLLDSFVTEYRQRKIDSTDPQQNKKNRRTIIICIVLGVIMILAGVLRAALDYASKN